ncbi:molybdate ABC transporter substrate-binding protein [Amycolatopsis alkalitolerans]|uniref:Molybdate-binding protein ModA n=1 Tax=Amycolatopsis alkalitolerans TaxID=2547244 RepID=A0A5C4M4Y4_9PSEU|nr:molybdate ABC transporter substrate-binding protein [Amycolatopsis alkalitolerans]TNC28136.1 molybdate ABC transporter substrate-binding protein [Amycolatopsis alkalitolerans]
MKKVLAVLAGVALLATGCGSSSSGSSAPPAKTLTVFAAASLTESFNALKSEFEAAHPGVTVKYDFGGSSTLVQQINNGAKVDVFASADQTNMNKAVQGGSIDGSPTVFATNKLTIAVAPGNPKGIKGFADLTRPGLKVVVCAAPVPCGAATQKVEKGTGVTLKPVSEEDDVKQVLTKVESGDADAGLVYVTDANSAPGKVTQVDFPESAQAINNYPMAVVKGAPQVDLARQFEQFVLGAQGKAELTKVGFGTPAK